jgi:hypothetical protein
MQEFCVSIVQVQEGGIMDHYRDVADLVFVLQEVHLFVELGVTVAS